MDNRFPRGANVTAPDLSGPLFRLVAALSPSCASGACLAAVPAVSDPEVPLEYVVASAAGPAASGLFAAASPPPVSSLRSAVERLTPLDAHAPALADALALRESSAHVSLLWHQAHKVAGSFPGYAPDDLVGWGWAGLRAALLRYDPSLGFAFSTYACTRIVGAMRDGVRSERPIPKRLGTFQRQVDRVELMLAERLGRTPSLEEVAVEMDVPPDKVAAAHRARPAASLEELSEARREPLGSFSLEGLLHLRSDVDVALAALDVESARVVRLVLFGGMTLPEVAGSTGRSVPDVRALFESGLSSLRSALESAGYGPTPA